MFDASAIAVTRYISARRMARLSWSGWHSHTSKYLTGSAWCNFIGCLMHWPLLHTTSGVGCMTRLGETWPDFQVSITMPVEFFWVRFGGWFFTDWER